MFTTLLRIKKTECFRYGKEHEDKAIDTLNNLIKKDNLEVQKCGLFVDTSKGYLAATPDGTISNDALVEVKCPIKGVEKSLQDLATTDSNFCLHQTDCGKLKLKKSHNYYYQIQGQLHIAKRSEDRFRCSVI